MENPHRDQEQKELKIVLVGDAGVGKTALITRFYTKKFEQLPATLSASFIKCKIESENGVIPVSLWDTAGQERYQSLIPMYLHHTHGCIIVFDITNPDALENINFMYEFVRGQLEPSVPVTIAGNKCDLVEKNDPDLTEIQDWARSNKVPLFKTSALLGINVDNLFEQIAVDAKRAYIDQFRNNIETDITKAPQKQEKSCC